MIPDGTMVFYTSYKIYLFPLSRIPIEIGRQLHLIEAYKN